MKQRITIEQYNELNEDQLTKYCGLGYGQDISVGEMIELVASVSGCVNMPVDSEGMVYDKGQMMQLCDALWDAVKAIL